MVALTENNGFTIIVSQTFKSWTESYCCCCHCVNSLSLYCEATWPCWTVSTLSCSFRNTTPPPALCPSYSFSTPHCHTSTVLSNLHTWANTWTKQRGIVVLVDKLLLSTKGTRWIPPRTKWKQETELQTTKVKRSLSGTLYQTLFILFRLFRSLCLCTLHSCGFNKWESNDILAIQWHLGFCGDTYAWRWQLYYVGQRLQAVLHLLPLFSVTPQTVLWSLLLKLYIVLKKYVYLVQIFEKNV